MTSFYEMMRTINKLINCEVNTLNKNDVEVVFEREANEQLKEELEYLGCEVNYVADIFNVRLPKEKFAREELNKEKRIESLYW